MPVNEFHSGLEQFPVSSPARHEQAGPYLEVTFDIRHVDGATERKQNKTRSVRYEDLVDAARVPDHLNLLQAVQLKRMRH
jgi:hypothetical protein